MYTLAFDFGDTFVEYGGLTFAIRLSTNKNIYCPSPDHTQVVEEDGRLRLISNQLWAAGGQLTAEGKLELSLERDDEQGTISIYGQGQHASELCKSLLIHVVGIDIQYVEADSDNMGRREFSYSSGIAPIIYPGRDAMMPLIIIGDKAADGGETEEWYVLSKDAMVRKKGFAAYYDLEKRSKVLILSFEEDRRHWSNEMKLPQWKIGKVQLRDKIVAERFNDLEQYFGLEPFGNREELQWIDDIRLVVNFHGEHWTGHVFNTFSDMEEQLRELCTKLPGKHILAFLPAWDGRYYYTYPYHSPGERLGGGAGLSRLVETAHSLGVKIVPMLGGPNLATRPFLEQHQLLDAALKDSEGDPQIQNWIDWNSDLSHENMGYVVNYGHPQLRAYMLKKVDELIDFYHFDGIFLDGAIRWSNAPDYSPYEGIVAFADEFSRRHPGKLLMGEDGYDVLWGKFGLFATSWGPLGLEHAMLRYTRQTEYLAYPALNGSSGIHEIGWNWNTIDKSKKAFTIPSLTLFAGDTKRYRDEIDRKLSECADWKLSSTT